MILNFIQDESYLNMDMTAVDRADPANTNVYLGNISPETSEEDLMLHYAGEKGLNRRGFKRVFIPLVISASCLLIYEYRFGPV